MKPSAHARFDFLVARDAPVCVVLRRKPTKMFHVVRWNTTTDALEYGSWFQGKIYASNCDVSFDGEWMIYSTLGGRGEEWTGLCQPPWLKTVLYQSRSGAQVPFAYWSDAKTLTGWGAAFASPACPFVFRQYVRDPKSRKSLSDLRLERDGWIRDGEDWYRQPTSKHPVLRNYQGIFSLEGAALTLDKNVTAAAWDCKGSLLVGRAGWLHRYTLKDLQSGAPSFSLDLEGLKLPSQKGRPKKRGPAIILPA